MSSGYSILVGCFRQFNFYPACLFSPTRACLCHMTHEQILTKLEIYIFQNISTRDTVKLFPIIAYYISDVVKKIPAV